jgi:hypothetical protein
VSWGATVGAPRWGNARYSYLHDQRDRHQALASARERLQQRGCSCSGSTSQPNSALSPRSAGDFRAVAPFRGRFRGRRPVARATSAAFCAPRARTRRVGFRFVVNLPKRDSVLAQSCSTSKNGRKHAGHFQRGWANQKVPGCDFRHWPGLEHWQATDSAAGTPDYIASMVSTTRRLAPPARTGQPLASAMALSMSAALMIE